MKRAIFIENTTGLHAALATKIVQTASKYPVDIELHYQNKVVDLKSILGLMSLAIPYGENVTLVATGTRAEEALEDIIQIFK
jgi:phosphocarrier protein